jgi:hypothetical protein
MRCAGRFAGRSSEAPASRSASVWQAERVTENSTRSAPAEPTTWLTVPEVGERLGLGVSRVHQLFRDGNLLAVRRDGVLRVPADLIVAPTDTAPDGAVVKHLSGVITLLRDARYSDEEIIAWLYTADDSLPGRPVDALRANRGTEVKRRAQAAGF